MSNKNSKLVGGCEIEFDGEWKIKTEIGKSTTIIYIIGCLNLNGFC